MAWIGSGSDTGIVTRSTRHMRIGCARRASGSRASRRTGLCSRLPSSAAIPGSSACSSIRNCGSRPFAPHPLFTSFIEAAIRQERLI